MSEEVTSGSWYAVNDAVKALGVSRKTIYKYINNEKLVAKMELGRRLVWVTNVMNSVKMSPGDTGDRFAQGNSSNAAQKLLVTKLKMRIELLEASLGIRQEQIDSLKGEVNRLGMLLMFEKRSVFSRIRDYFIGTSSTPGVGIRL